MMRGSFKWNGVDSADYGVHITRQPDLIQSAERMTFQTVPGRHGTVALSQSMYGKPVYEDVIMAVDCIIDAPFATDLLSYMIENVGAWLTGYGELELPFLPNRYFKAHVTSQIPFSQIMRGREPREFTITFRCDPFVYFANTSLITFTQSENKLLNPGNVDSEPKITVTLNSGTGLLQIGDSAIYFSNLSGDVTVDCAAGIVYKNSPSSMFGANEVEIAEGFWPKFWPGLNAVNWSGGITKVVIEPRWRSRL